MGTLLGRGYPELVLIGAPCPTTVLTFGLLLWTERRVPRYLLAIPLLWALVGLTSVSAGLWDDLGLTICGLVGMAVILYRDAQLAGPAPEAATAVPGCPRRRSILQLAEARPSCRQGATA